MAAWGKCVLVAGVLGIALLGAACGEEEESRDEKAEGRVVQIVAQNDGCTPTSVAAKPGEKLSFEVTNKADKDRELEGIEGTKLEEVLIPKGRTRTVNYTAPSTAGTQKLKCYAPSGPTTVIELAVK